MYITEIIRTHNYDLIHLNGNIENKYLSLRLSSGFSSSSETLSSSEEESSGCRFFFADFGSRFFLAFGALPKNDKAGLQLVLYLILTYPLREGIQQSKNQLTDNATIIFSKSQFVPPFSLQIWIYSYIAKKKN